MGHSKLTVDYFPHYCYHNKTIPILENRYGDRGYAVWFKTLERLGRTENHYLDISNQIDFEYLATELKCPREVLEDIYNLCAELGAIDPILWSEYRVIWSQHFVNNLYPLYARRAEKPLTYKQIIEYLESKRSGNPPEPPKPKTVVTSRVKSYEPSVPDYIDQIIDIFARVYEREKGVPYIKRGGKDRKAVGQLIAMVREKRPELTTEQSYEVFEELFTLVCKPQKNNYYNEITLAKLNSNINEYLLRIQQQINSEGSVDYDKYYSIKQILEQAGL